MNEAGLLRSARGGSRLVSCAERDCCPRGFEDMLADPRRHEVRQALESLEALQSVPSLHRAPHFVGETLAKAARRARDVAALELKSDQADKFGVARPEGLKNTLVNHASMLDRKQRVLESALKVTDGGSRSASIGARRTRAGVGVSAIRGRGR